MMISTAQLLVRLTRRHAGRGPVLPSLLPSRLPSRLASLLLLFHLVTAGGCRMRPNLVLGQSTTRYFQTPDGNGRAVHVSALGLSLRTVRGDAGVTLGHSSRTYYLPGPRSTEENLSSHAIHGSESSTTCPEQSRLVSTHRFDWSGRVPVAIAGKDQGIAISIHSRLRTTLGARSSTALILPADSSTTLFISHTGLDPSQCSLAIKQLQEPSP